MPLLDVKTSDYKSRVALCTMRDVVERDGVMQLIREPIATVWAQILFRPTFPSFISPYGYAMSEPQDRITHLITMRYRVYVDFSSAGWLYEKRLITPPRWYKVVGFADNDPWMVVHCHLVEKSINATVPATPSRNKLSAEQVEL